MTMGEWLFYGGIVGVVLVCIVSLTTFLIMRESGKRLRKKLDAEYGKKDS